MRNYTYTHTPLLLRLLCIMALELSFQKIYQEGGAEGFSKMHAHFQKFSKDPSWMAEKLSFEKFYQEGGAEGMPMHETLVFKSTSQIQQALDANPRRSGVLQCVAVCCSVCCSVVRSVV